jgi:ADP-ribosyl-[dinitrogen reductase] hydrolase
MILEAAIGDAYGAGFEFREMEFIIENNHLDKYHPHGLYTEIYKCYTDDTQMALALAELLLETDDWDEEKVANKFVEVFHRDKRRGYSDRVYNALDASKNGLEFMKVLNRGSNGNGSAMRAYTLGYIPEIPKLLEFARIQAVVSHDTEEGIICAKRIALIVHYYIYNIQDVSLVEFLNMFLPIQNEFEIASPIDMHGYPTTNAIINIVSKANNMRDCLLDCINYGGDTDTVAALSMAILSVKEQVDRNLPQFLFDDLENGEFGKDYLMDIDTKLKLKFNTKTT